MKQQSIKIYNQYYLSEAIDFIREHEPPEGYFVGFSGGKDSIVTYELVKMSGVKHQAYYSCTGIDPPEIVKFIRQNYPEVIWKYPKISFWEGIKRKSPPFRQRRWCCDVLKKNPTKGVPLQSRIMGLRAEESARRAARGQIDQYKKLTVYKPIFNWLEWQIWEFIEEKKMAYPCLYDEGFDRIGCVICPFLTKRKMEINKERWPYVYLVFEKVVKEWFVSHYGDRAFNTADEYLEFWYSG